MKMTNTRRRRSCVCWGQGWRYNNNIKGRDGQTAGFQIRAPLARLLPLTATNNNCRSTLLFCI